MPDKCCGTCEYSRRHEGADEFVDCRHPVMLAVLAAIRPFQLLLLPDALDLPMMAEDGGRQCPCYEPKERA